MSWPNWCGVEALGPFRRLGGHLLIALDGTEYFCSQQSCCPRCSQRARAGGKIEYFHAMLGAPLVAPGHTQVVPLEPEFIAPHDGTDKQDCESRAARRWLAAHGRSYASFNPVYLGDDLFAHQPLCEAVLAVGGHFVFVCKPSSHTLIQEYLTGVDLETLTVPVQRGRQRGIHRYRWLCDVPLRDGTEALTVNWFEIEISAADGTVTYRNSFITDLAVGPNTVVDLVACGRARWKIENETFNVLKTGGYNLEHSFGHGKQNLAALLVTLNLLAFACHTVADIAEEFWRKARSKVRSRLQFFNNLAALTAFLIFSSWDDLLQTLAFAKPPRSRRDRGTPRTRRLSIPARHNVMRNVMQISTRSQNENCWPERARLDKDLSKADHPVRRQPALDDTLSDAGPSSSASCYKRPTRGASWQTWGAGKARAGRSGPDEQFHLLLWGCGVVGEGCAAGRLRLCSSARAPDHYPVSSLVTFVWECGMVARARTPSCIACSSKTFCGTFPKTLLQL